jgi:uncharacterized protein (TIGR03437 family)
VLALAFATGFAQAQAQPEWRKVGPSAADLRLASAATGPVSQVWFSPQGSILYARMPNGQTFQTADYETWFPAPGEEAPPPPPQVEVVRRPEPGASVMAVSAGGAVVFAGNRNLHRSDDGGRSWANLTAYQSQPVIGAGQHSVAVSPADPERLAVANDFGVWLSADGGIAWTGLNQALPNLPVRRILSTPSGAAGTRIQVEEWPGALELPPGGAFWVPAPGAALESEDARKQRFTAALGTPITAVASAGDTVYAGSGDGRIWFSTDGGAHFQSSRLLGVSGRVERIYADPAQPRAALAALSGAGPHVLRTFNGGDFWDAMDSNLPDASAYSVTADASTGAVYVASSKGVFWASVDLLTAGAPPHWTDLSGGLPPQSAYDVLLDPAAVQLYVAVDGYGVYATPAPHRRRNLRVVSTADFSARPAAPGSLLSVVGARVTGARGGDLDYPVLGTPTDGESEIQVPYDATGPAVALLLDTSAGQVSVGLQVQPVSPAIFVGLDGAPMLFDADSGSPLDSRDPARAGQRIQIFATGLGRVRPNWPAGLATPLEGSYAVTAPVRAYLDGAPLRVTRAALAPGYVGFYLIEVELPLVANYGASQLYISADGQESNRVQLVVEP